MMSAHTVKRRRLSPSPQDRPEQDSTGLQKDAGLDANGTDNHAPSKNANRNELSTVAGAVKKGNNDRMVELALASGFYKSSFFKLQMDELLTELRPNYDKQDRKSVV